jgi:hypothetical protein
MIIVIIIILKIIIQTEDLPTDPADSNVNAKETEKLSKYKDLQNEVSRVWKEKTKVLQVIFGALGIIKHGLDHPLAIELKKVIVVSTAHSIRKVLG